MMRAVMVKFVGLVALVLVPALAAGELGSGDFGCSFFGRSATSQVDGSLSDWDSGIATQPLRWSRSTSGESTGDGTATARCMADDSFLYLGVSISASPLRFETTPFNQAWRNDAVEVFLSSLIEGPSMHVRTGLLRVSSDSMGRTITEGLVSVRVGHRTTRSFSHPLLWDALGVKAGLQRTSTGYTVEVAIPRSSLGWTEAVTAPRVALNVRVRRSCGDKPCQEVLESSDDPYDTSPFADDRYRRVSFRRQAPAQSSALRRGSEDDRILALFRALVCMDAFDPVGAVAVLRETRDRRLFPLMATALIAAGQFDSAVSVLNSISLREFGDSVRFWVSEQVAYTHLLMGDSAAAETEYENLAASGGPAFQDIGVAGLIDLHLADGRIDGALAAYWAVFGESTSPGTRSASRIADWFQKHGRLQEAIDVLTRVSESGSAHDSELAWALLQLQSLYHRSGDIDKAFATGWRLQALAPPGDPSAEAGLKKLIAVAAFGRAAPSPVPAFSDSYGRFLEANPRATDPARQLAYASELRWEGKLDEAAKAYEEVSRETSARRRDRAAALLGLQRLQLDSGQVERSMETGLAIQGSFAQELGSSLPSWQLMRSVSAASGTPNSLRRQVDDFGRSLASEIRRLAQDATVPTQRPAQALLLRLEKELNLQ